MDEKPTESRKRQQIVAGARSVFLDRGYEGASMEEVARGAGVSKGTLYNYFAEKSELFAAVVEAECQVQAQRIFSFDHEERDVAGTLRRVATTFVDFLLSPFAQSIYRMAVAEAIRFPDLSRVFYATGPNLGRQRLAQFLAVAVARGDLVIDDVDLAAFQFIALCRAELFDERLLQVRTRVPDADMRRIVEGTVHVFMKAYGV